MFSDFALNSGKKKFLKIFIYFFCENVLENFLNFFSQNFLGSRLSWGNRVLGMN